MSNIPSISQDIMSIVPTQIYPRAVNYKIFFDWDKDINVNTFKVVYEDLSGEWKSLGPVKSCVNLPYTYFPEYAKLAVIGLNSLGQQVRFVGTLIKGAKYHLANVKTGDYQIEASRPLNCNGVAVRA